MKLSNIAKSCVTFSFPSIALIGSYLFIDAVTGYVLPKDNYTGILFGGVILGLLFTTAHIISEGHEGTL